MRLAVLLLATSCYTAAAPPPATIEAPKPHAPPRLIASTDPLAYLPADAEVVVVVDAKAIKGSEGWKQLHALIQPKFDAALSLFTQKCNFDPLAQLRQMSIGLRDTAGTPTGVVVIRGYPRERSMACITAMADRDGRKVTVDHGVVTLPTSYPMVFTFADDTTLVSMIGPDATAAALIAAIDGGAPLRMSPQLAELEVKVEHSQLWFVFMGNAKVFGSMGGLGGRPQGMMGRLDLAAELDGEVRMRFERADQATAAVGIVQSQLSQVSALIPGLGITDDDVDAVLHIHMTEPELEMVLRLMWP